MPRPGPTRIRHLVALAAALIASCGTTPPIPDDHFYRLVPTVEFTSGPRVLEGLLVVDRPEAAGVRRDRAILYSRSPYISFKRYHYHHWEESPPRLLHQRLIGALREAGVATHVVEISSADAAYRLHTRINRFERLLGEQGAETMVEIDVRLIDVEAPESPLLQRSYRQRSGAGSNSMDDTIVAFSRAVDQVIMGLIEDLREQ